MVGAESPVQIGLARPAARIGRAPLAIGGTLVAGLAAGALAAFAGPLYAFAGLLGLVGVLVMLASQRATLLGFVAVATLLPYGVAPLPIGGVRPTFIDLTLAVLLLTWVFRLLSRQDASLVATPADGPLVAFLGLAVAAFLFGTGYAITPETTRQYLKLLNSTFFFFTITQTVRTRADLALLARALVVGGALAALVAVALYHLSPEPASTWLRSLGPLGYPRADVLRYVEDAGVRTTMLRATGTSIDPNVLGALLMTTGLLALPSALSAARGRERALWLGGLAVIGYGLLVSLSRGSWVGFAVGFAIVALARHRRALWIVPAALVPGLLLFGDELSGYAEHFLKAVYAQDQATGMRLGEYKDALTLIQQNPWLGVGFGGTPSSDLYLGVSSTYLMVAEEMGLLGLLAFLVAFGTVLTVGARAYRGLSEAAKPLALGCLAAFAGVLTSALFDKHFFDLRYQHISALFWMLAALVILSTREESADNRA
jgi:polysaccharide biosynthesis protein PslJ